MIAISIILCSCNMKINTPKMPSTFNQNAVVTLGDFSFDCEICKDESNVTAKINSTNANGLVMTYDGKNVNFKYNDFSYDIDGENFEKANISIIIFDVINVLSNENTKKYVIDGGIKYEGETNYGSFILVQNNDTTLKSLTFKDKEFKVVFK